MNHSRPGFFNSAMIVGFALTFASSVSFAAPNTGSGPQKTEKQCKDERAKCLKDCDQLIDIDNNIQRCKDRCTDAYIMCTPLRVQPGGKLQGVRPQLVPQQNAPILRRGIEGEQPAETESGTPPTTKGSTGAK
jgi:hypothetical protein